MKSFYFLFLISILVFSCNFKKKGDTSTESDAKGNHEVTVAEVIQGGSYTYLRLKEGDKEYWAAVSAMDAKPGKTFYYNKSMEMSDFKSRELNRTFSSIYFIDQLSEKPVQEEQVKLSTSGRQNLGRAEGIKVEKADGGITIAELVTDKTKYENKEVKITGQVIKFSPEIMQKNWVHIQDGTEASGQYDLVVTTNDVVKPGDVVTFEGKILLNKDFGYGYKYDILMEEAKALPSGNIQ